MMVSSVKRTALKKKKGCLLMHVWVFFVQEESLKVRAETKLDINLENSRISDMVCLCVCVCSDILQITVLK